MIPDFVVMAGRSARSRDRMDRTTRALRSLGLGEVARRRDLVVLGTPRSITVAGGLILHGFVVGNPEAAGRLCDADPAAAAGRLTMDCWGNYVALLLGREQASLMADPSGAGRMHLCCDDEMLLATDLLTPAIARLAGFTPIVRDCVLAGGLIDPPTLVAESALEGVRHLVPGVLTPLDPTRRGLTVWEPAAFRGEDRDGRGLVLAVERAVAGLRGARPLVQTSGGLDSAIVLGTAARQGAATAFSVVGASGDVDESPYASAAARRAGVGLVIASEPTLPRFNAFTDVTQIAHPYLHGLDDSFDRQMEEATVRHGCDMILTGQGGDAVFLQPMSAATTIDRYVDGGVRELLRGLPDDARRCRSSIWRPLSAVLRHLVRGTAPLRPSALTPHLLNPDALASAKRIQHPWARSRSFSHPGRALQARLLANSTVVHTRRPRPGFVPIVHPLLAQPVLEEVLGIATWALASGPMDRGLARRAFADRIPTCIARRPTKGQASAHFSRAVLANLPLLRERLLDGRLVARGLLDQDALDGVLRQEHLIHSIDYRSLMFVASCEAWITAWS